MYCAFKCNDETFEQSYIDYRIEHILNKGKKLM